MRCKACGFIYNGPEIKCPYCGNFVNNEKENFASRKYSFLGLIELTGIQIIGIVLINIFLIALGVNFAVNADYFWFIYVGLACETIYLTIKIIFLYKNAITAIRKFDLIVSFFIIIWLVSIDGNDIVASYIVPCYVSLISFTEFLLIVIFKKIKFVRNLFFTLWHTLQIMVPFILMKFGLLAANATKEIKIIYFISLSLCVLIFLNNLVLFILLLKNKAKEWIN